MKNVIKRQSFADSSALMRLRALLDEAEPLLVAMRSTPDGATRLLAAMDQVDALLAELRGPQYDVRAEANRADAVRDQILKEAEQVARLVRANGQTAALADSLLWQRIDAEASARRQKKMRRRLIFGGALVVIIAALAIILPRVLPEPVAQANVLAISDLVQQQQLDQAMQRAKEETARAPEDPSGFIWLGMVQQQTGDTAAAQASWQQAETLIGDKGEFLFTRGLTWAQTGNNAAAEADAKALIDTPDTAAEGWYLLGGIREAQGLRGDAIDAYNRAADLASAANKSELTVAARTRVGFLLQQIDLPTPQP